MKQLLKFTLSLLLLLPLAVQAQDQNSILKMDSLAQQLYDRENYMKCVEVLHKQKDLLDEKDSLYFANLRFQARCYFRMKDSDNAIKAAKAALDNWEQYQDTNNVNYILMLDNYAFYLSTADKPDYETALKYSKEALSRYEKRQQNDESMAVILFHVAENCSLVKQYADAVKYELRALSIYKNLYGEHDDSYIRELDYLADFYEGNGQMQKAQETRNLQEKLSKEQEDGIADLPEMIEFKTPDECRAHKADALKMVQYYLGHLLSADKMENAAQYIMNWSAVTDLVHITIGKEEAQLFTEKYYPYAVAYIAGCCEAALVTDSADFSRDMFRYAIASMLEFYDGGNKDLTGKVPYLEKYMKAANKENSAPLLALLDKYYDKLMKEVEKEGVSKVDTSK